MSDRKGQTRVFSLRFWQYVFRPPASGRGPNTRYALLDPLRGLACLIVVAVHANHTNGGVETPSGLWDQTGNFTAAILKRGWIAVPMFFVVSGYGISQAVDSLRRRPRSTRKFVARRFVRLFPPYLLSTVLFSLAVITFGLLANVSLANYFIRDPASLSLGQWIGNYSLTEICRDRFVGAPSTLLADHYWTLNYELQFYIIVALILLLARNSYFAIVASLTLAVVAIQFSPTWIRESVDGFIVRRHWLVFAAGILVYWQINYATRMQRRLCNIGLLLTMIIAAMDWELMTSPIWSPRAAVAFTAGFALLLVNLVAWDHRISSLHWLRPLTACGAISYSIYLTHPLIVRCVDLVVEDWLAVSPTVKSICVVPIVVVLSVGFGWAFYFVAERHFTASASGAARSHKAIGAPAVAKG